MKIEPNQYIKIMFKNGISIEGIVISWEQDNFVLKSDREESFFIIQNPKDDIIAIKIMIKQKQIAPAIAPQIPINETNKLSEEELKIRKIADLRIALAQQEKEIISNKLKNDTINEVRKVEYGLPGFFKKQSSE